MLHSFFSHLSIGQSRLAYTLTWRFYTLVKAIFLAVFNFYKRVADEHEAKLQKRLDELEIGA